MFGSWRARRTQIGLQAKMLELGPAPSDTYLAVVCLGSVRAISVVTVVHRVVIVVGA